jgi:hypothetical protein
MIAASREFEQADELCQLSAAEMSEQVKRRLLNHRVHLFEQLQSGVGDPRPDNAAIVVIALLADELERFEAGEQAGNVRLGSNHPSTDGGTGEPVGLRAAQDSEYVVLRGSNPPVARGAVESAVHVIGGAHQVEQRLFFHAGEGRFLSDL